jgi:hypothetical protein
MSKFIPFYLAGGLIAFSWGALPEHGPWDGWDLALFQVSIHQDGVDGISSAGMG